MRFRLIATGMAALSMLAVSYATQAADGPPPKPVYKARKAAPVVPVAVPAYYNWNGLYGGFVLGYGWATSSWAFPASTSTSPTGLMLGGTIGYNTQMNQYVMGFEADLSWSGVKGSAVCGAFVCETASRWLDTFRVRIGFPTDRMLPYLTGGLAYGNVRATTSNPALAGGSAARLGWTAGGGLEFAMANNMSAKVEYLYVDLGSFDCGAGCVAGVTANNVNFRESILRFGLNWKLNALGGPISARY